MAITEKKQIWFWSTGEQGPMPIRVCQMAASQGVIMPGSPMEVNSSGLMELSDTDDTSLSGFLVGVVERSTAWPLTAALAANDKVRVAIVRAKDILAVFADSGGNDIAVTQAMIGHSFAITVDATTGQVGYTTCDVGDEAGTMFKAVDIASNKEPALYTTSDNPGVILVKVITPLG